MSYALRPLSVHPVRFATPLAACILGWLGQARADVAIEGSSTAQFYDVRSPTGEVTLSRRRVTTELGVDARTLFGDAEQSVRPEWSMRARFRVDGDFGIPYSEVDPAALGTFVPGLSRASLDLAYGYMEGRRLLSGWGSARVGRQIVIDAAGFWAFDGVTLRVHTPWFVTVEALGGMEVRGGLPLSTGRYEAGGVWRGDRSGFDPALAPSFQPAGIAPAYGVAVESSGLDFLSARLSYRSVTNTGSVGTTQFAGGPSRAATLDSARVSSEKLAASVDLSTAKLGALHGGFVYDLFLDRPTTLRASADVFAGSHVVIGADYDYFVPSFDGDSIFNIFAAESTNDVSLRATVQASSRWSLAALGNLRLFGTQTRASQDKASPNGATAANTYPGSGVSYDGGGSTWATYRNGGTRIWMRASGSTGWAGYRAGVDASAEHTLEGRLLLSGRVSTWGFRDDLRPDRDAVSVGYVVGTGYRFGGRTVGRAEWQHDMNRLVGHRFRWLLTLEASTF